MTENLIARIDHWIARNAAAPLCEAAGSPQTSAVVVTGGSSGIGLAIARVFHSQGRTVVLVARDEARLAAAKATFPASDPTRVITLALDVTAADAVQTLEAALAAAGLYLDVLVNSAGLGLAGPFESHSEADIARLLDVNIVALTRLTRHVLPGMKARGRGGVLNVASLGGYVPGPNQAAYYASKAYVCSLTEALGAELSGSGVRMTVLAPGPVETRFHARMGADNAFYRWIIPALSPGRTARAAVFGYWLGRRVVVPGFGIKVMAVAITILPHWLTLTVIRALLAPRYDGESSVRQK